MKKLDRETAIALFREQWRLLAADGERTKKDVLKNEQTEAVEEYGWPRNACWLCEYIGFDRDTDICCKCPIEWVALRESPNAPCTEGLYGVWGESFDPKIAAEIAELPERKTENED
jgi:hypothetical protein